MQGVAFRPPPDVLEHLSGVSASRRARDLLHARLAGHDEFAGRRHDAVLLISELVTNAITAASSCVVSIWYLHRALRVEVRDTSPRLPQMQPFHAGRIGGHGLRIVDSIATAWGTVPEANGKTVWFEIIDRARPG